MPRALSSLVVVAATLQFLTGCSGGEEPAEATPPSPNVKIELSPKPLHEIGLARLYAGDSTDTQEQLDGFCFSDALLERLDEDQLIDAGIVTPRGKVTRSLPVFDEATASAWVDAQLSCVDFVEASTRALLTQTHGELDSEAYATCLAAALSDAEIRAALVQTLSGGFDSPEVAALTDAQATCSV
ncbi:hypothetical protein BH09ACT12_BH09ACT12_12650 [soil metagenome]